MNKIEVLEKEEVHLIHSKTLELLERIGIKVESEEARILLKKNGASVDDNTMAINEIKRVATEGKNYLMLKHTSKNTRKELFVPKLADRDRRGIWERNGAKDIIERASEKVEQILKNQKGPGISHEVESAFQEFYKKISSRTYEDYQKAEGLDKAEGTRLPNME